MNNEKRMQETFKLRYKPARFIKRENAVSFAYGCIKPERVMVVGKNRFGFTEGFYSVCPADAERLYKQGFNYLK